MAEPGDPHRPVDAPGPAAPASDHDWNDDLIGFASAASLGGKPAPRPEPEPPSEPEPAAQPEPAPEPDLFDGADEAAPTIAAAAPPLVERPVPTPSRRDAVPDRPQPPGVLSLYSVYALILFAVPTFGVSALIGLLAVTGREPPADPLARSHFIYQQRTLWAAGLAALLGIILIVVNIGVFVLFALSLWILARGAVGVFRLKAGRPISDPRHWLF